MIYKPARLPAEILERKAQADIIRAFRLFLYSSTRPGFKIWARQQLNGGR